MLQLSLLMLVFILVVALTIEMAAFLAVQFFSHLPNYYTYFSMSILAACAIASIRVFEAIAIQFGMDQLLEASSDQLSTFVHWYFWATHLGQKLVFLIGVIVTLIRQLFFSADEFDLLSLKELPFFHSWHDNYCALDELLGHIFLVF